MATIRLTATAGADGVLHLALPVGAGEYEVAVEVTPKPAAGRKPTPEELGWPPGFFEQVVGSIDDPAFQRYPQGEFEPRGSIE